MNGATSVDRSSLERVLRANGPARAAFYASWPTGPRRVAGDLVGTPTGAARTAAREALAAGLPATLRLDGQGCLVAVPVRRVRDELPSGAVVARVPWPAGDGGLHRALVLSRLVARALAGS